MLLCMLFLKIIYITLAEINWFQFEHSIHFIFIGQNEIDSVFSLNKSYTDAVQDSETIRLQTPLLGVLRGKVTFKQITWLSWYSGPFDGGEIVLLFCCFLLIRWTERIEDLFSFACWLDLFALCADSIIAPPLQKQMLLYFTFENALPIMYRQKVYNGEIITLYNRV